MICTTLQNKDYDGILSALDDPMVEMAEIRLDRCSLTLEEVDELFSSCDTPLIATCRVGDNMPAQQAETLLTRAVHAGAAYVDLELEAPAMMCKRIRREAHDCGTALIRSWHDFDGTDSLPALQALCEKCRHLGADVVKIVTTAHSEADCEKVLGLYETETDLVAFCMGEAGRNSRLECLRLGAPYTYAALTEEEAAAPGQWPLREMYKAVYGDRKPLDAPTLTMPSSKSFAQRAIIAAALAEGTSRLFGYSTCGDNESALAVARALGAKVTVDDSTITIEGRGTKAFTDKCLHTGESGFLTRLMIPLMGALASSDVTISGEKTLTQRPLKGAKAMMAAAGLSLESDSDPVKVPLTVKGRLHGGLIEVDGSDGSQLVSGLLTALPLLREDSTLVLNNPKSIPYLFITVDVLKQFGIRIESEMEGGEEFVRTRDWSLCEAITFHIRGGQRLKAAEVDIEADWSAAANFAVAGAVFGRVELEGLDTTSLQADLSIMDILTEAGASISEEDDTGILHVQKAPLRAINMDLNNCPDLFPATAVLAAFCSGTSTLEGVGRLATKETDRGAAILAMLRQMGVRSWIKGDRLIIEGRSLACRLLTGTLLKGGSYTSCHDHRMVMALETAALGADGPITIDDTSCVCKSYPGFPAAWEEMKQINN